MKTPRGGPELLRRVNQFTPPPRALRRARLDNLAVVPGSALPYIERCHQLANQLPENGVLVVLPPNQPAQRKALLAVAKLLAAQGHQVRVLPAEEVRRPPCRSREDRLVCADVG